MQSSLYHIHELLLHFAGKPRNLASDSKAANTTFITMIPLSKRCVHNCDNLCCQFRGSRKVSLIALTKVSA